MHAAGRLEHLSSIFLNTHFLCSCFSITVLGKNTKTQLFTMQFSRRNYNTLPHLEPFFGQLFSTFSLYGWSTSFQEGSCSPTRGQIKTTGGNTSNDIHLSMNLKLAISQNANLAGSTVRFSIYVYGEDKTFQMKI